MLALYCVAVTMNMICWMSMSAVSGALESGYGVSGSSIAAFGFIFMIAFIPTYFPSAWMLDVYGLRNGLIFGSLLTCIGMWIKCLINNGFFWAWIGQVIAGCGQPLLAISIPKLSAYWFGKDEVSFLF
jgi:fucose permease